jgi:spermidine/putrescine transport system permease protein
VSSAVEPRRGAVRPRLTRLGLALPLAWIVALVLVPNALLVVYSLWRANNGVIVHDWTITNYRQVFSSELIRVLLWRTLYTALGAALLATFIAYPLAYFVTRRLGRHRLTAALLVPFDWSFSSITIHSGIGYNRAQSPVRLVT